MRVRTLHNRNRSTGFTLVEMLIVVVIIGVLAAVAIVAYSRHIKSSRLVAERAFMTALQAKQEAYFQSYGQYHDTSGTAGGLGSTCPAALSSDEPVAKVFPGACAQAWRDFGVLPKGGATYFIWRIEASATPNHAAYGNAASYGATAGAPWYYIEAEGDLDGNSASNTRLYTSSGRADMVTLNEGD